MSQLRKCVNLAPLNSQSVAGRPDLDPTSAGAAIADYRRADVKAFFRDSLTTHVRMFAVWFDIEGVYRAEGSRISSIRSDIVVTLDQNIEQARADGKNVVLCARSYASWANNSYTIDPFYSPEAKFSGRTSGGPPDGVPAFNLAAWRGSLPDRTTRAAIRRTNQGLGSVDPSRLKSVKDARFRFPGNALLATDQAGAFNVAPGSDFAFWMTFLLARYHPDRRLLAALSPAELGHYAALLVPRPDPRPPEVDDSGGVTPACPIGYQLGAASGSAADANGNGMICRRTADQSMPAVLPAPPAGAVVQYFEFVNEPNGPEGWPQQAPSTNPGDAFAPGPVASDKVIADMFVTMQGIARMLAAKSVALGGSAQPTPTLLGPACSDEVGGSLVSELVRRGSKSSRTSTTSNTFVLALLNELRALAFDPTAGAGVAIGFSQHNYTDIEKARVGGIVAGLISPELTNAAALTRRILLRRGWRGIGGPQNPQLFLTEGGARINKIAKLYPGQDARAKQAQLINDAWTQMSRQTTGLRLGRGIAMFSQFLFYTIPPDSPIPFDSGLCDVATRDASGHDVLPADNGASKKRPAFATWSQLTGAPPGPPEAP